MIPLFTRAVAVFDWYEWERHTKEDFRKADCLGIKIVMMFSVSFLIIIYNIM